MATKAPTKPAPAVSSKQKYAYSCLNCKRVFAGVDGEEKALRHVTADNDCTTRAYKIHKVSA